jgi:hypothetical protein
MDIKAVVVGVDIIIIVVVVVVVNFQIKWSMRHVCCSVHHNKALPTRVGQCP